MAGLLTSQTSTAPNATPAPGPNATPSAPTPTKGQMDPMLAKIQQDIESKLPPNVKDAADRIIVAGLKILYSPQTHPIVQTLYDKIQKDGFQPTAIATGMVNFLGMIYKASRGKMSVAVAFPAGVVLLCYVLDDLEKTRGLKITQPLVKDIGKQMASQMKTMLTGGGAQPSASSMPQPPQPAPPMTPPANATGGA